MKIFSKIILIISLFVFIFSCRDMDDIPEDVFEHDEIGKVVLKMTEKDQPSNVQTVNVISGIADAELVMEKNKTYVVDLDFQINHDGHYHSSDEIEEEKDHHFITFNVANAEMQIKRTVQDIVRTDGQRLGKKSEWSLQNKHAGAKVNIKLIHGAASVNQNFPSIDNQLGQTSGGEADVDILVNIK